MKKVLSIIILTLVTLGLFGSMVYYLYVKPLTEIKVFDKWYEYVVFFIILIVMYAIILFVLRGIFKLIDWVVSHVD